jgi:hypothetical protein
MIIHHVQEIILMGFGSRNSIPSNMFAKVKNINLGAISRLVLISTLELQVEFHDGRRQFSR